MGADLGADVSSGHSQLRHHERNGAVRRAAAIEGKGEVEGHEEKETI